MLGHVDMQTSIHNMRGPPRRHSALFHFLSRQLNHRSPRPPSTSSHHVSDYQPKYQLDNFSADRVYHIGSTANSPVSGDRIDRESVRRRTPQRRRFLHASRMAFPRGITGRRVGPLGLDPPFASPSTANFVAEAVRWRVQEGIKLRERSSPLVISTPDSGLTIPSSGTTSYASPIPDGRSSTCQLTMSPWPQPLNFYTDFFAECPANPSDPKRAILNHVASHVIQQIPRRGPHSPGMGNSSSTSAQQDIPMSSRTSNALFGNSWETTRQPLEVRPSIRASGTLAQRSA